MTWFHYLSFLGVEKDILVDNQLAQDGKFSTSR